MKYSLILIVLLPLFLISVLFPVLGSASLISLEVSDGKFCVDDNTDGDGLFNNGCGGPSYTFSADNRAALGSSAFPRRMRTSLEYDISSVLGNSISSANLILYFGNARDLSSPSFPSPESELLGYVGDGATTPSDMLSTNLLLRFSPPPYTFVNLNVTSFVQSLLLAGNQYAGFTFRIKDDYLSGIFSDASFVGEISIGANSDANRTPKLIINTVPEPSSLMLFFVGVGILFLRIKKQTR